MTQRIMTIQDYSDWTLSVWYSPNNNDLTNISVMALGLAGEVSEVIAECLIDDSNLEIDKQYELGDVIYYWTRICNTFDLDIVNLYNQSAVIASKEKNQELKDLLLGLSKNSGLAADVIKKFIRDEKLNQTLLEDKLLGVMSNLLCIINHYNFHFFDIINLNVSKIEKRKKQKK